MTDGKAAQLVCETFSAHIPTLIGEDAEVCVRCGKILTCECVSEEWVMPDDGVLPEDERVKYRQAAGHIRIIGEAMLTEWFGERCPDFLEDCDCCKRWRALDVLTDNPFDP